jgi:DNA-binding response OmpR family regulator
MYDAIVTDLMMPGFSGLDVLTAMRRHLSGIPVVVITAFGDARTRRTAEALGSVSVLNKPFDMDDLRATLASSLRNSAERGAAPPSAPSGPATPPPPV